MNKGLSLISLGITVVIILLLVGIVLSSAEEMSQTQSCEFGNHYYVCAKCGKELIEK